jgi:hypothetical protein
MKRQTRFREQGLNLQPALRFVADETRLGQHPKCFLKNKPGFHMPTRALPLKSAQAARHGTTPGQGLVFVGVRERSPLCASYIIPRTVKLVAPVATEFCRPQASRVGIPLVKKVEAVMLAKAWQLSKSLQN